jgi:hypothetical protein
VAFGVSSYAFVIAAESQYVDQSPDAVRIGTQNRRKLPTTLFNLAKKLPLGLGRPSGKATFSESGTLEKAITTIRWTEISPMSIDYASIFEAIANQNFGSRRPRVYDRIYFVDPERHVILHMYDDRGMDVIARDRATLQPLYSKFGDWILEHDRSQIDRTFQELD